MIRLLELRTDKKYSQRETARMLNISQGTYNNWENDKTQPSIEQLIALSKMFQTSVDYMIGNSDDYGLIRVVQNKTASELNILKLFDKCNPKSQNLLLEFLDSLHS